MTLAGLKIWLGLVLLSLYCQAALIQISKFQLQCAFLFKQATALTFQYSCTVGTLT